MNRVLLPKFLELKNKLFLDKFCGQAKNGIKNDPEDSGKC